MGFGLRKFGVALLVGLGILGLSTPSQGASLCQTKTLVPGLPQVSCRFPSCPAGGDCQAPVIQTTKSKVEFFEPLLRWKENCADLNSPCWEIYLDLRFDVAATDAAGISRVGIVLYEELRGQRKTRTLWAKARGSRGVYTAQKSLHLFAPARAKLELGVLEACAEDRLGNQQCRIPAQRARWQIGDAPAASE